jgi:hypothetical protein
MKLFTNAAKTRFFTTENQVKNLHEIEVNSIHEAVADYGICSPLVFLDINQLYANDLDQVKEKPAHHEVDSIDLGFGKDLSYAEIIGQALDIYDYDGQLDFIFEVVFKFGSEDKTNDDDTEVMTITPSDNSVIVINMDHFTKEISYTVGTNTTK